MTQNPGQYPTSGPWGQPGAGLARRLPGAASPAAPPVGRRPDRAGDPGGAVPRRRDPGGAGRRPGLVARSRLRRTPSATPAAGSPRPRPSTRTRCGRRLRQRRRAARPRARRGHGDPGAPPSRSCPAPSVHDFEVTAAFTLPDGDYSEPQDLRTGGQPGLRTPAPAGVGAGPAAAARQDPRLLPAAAAGDPGRQHRLHAPARLGRADEGPDPLTGGAAHPGPPVTLREITPANRAAVEALRVSPSRRRTSTASAVARRGRGHPGSRPWCRASTPARSRSGS